jgi:predicted acyltransferase
MFLLLAEGTHMFYFINGVVPENTFLGKLALQLLHAEWHGLHFWDLIQPYFTFIVGVAMAFSLNKRWRRGDSWSMTFRHMLVRCAVLFLLGVVLQIGYRERLVWELWNILTQLSVSILITFLIFRFPLSVQLIISFALLFITEISYRYILIEGFDQPFVKDRNLGAFIDLMLMGKVHPDGWVAFSCIPTTAHMIWGGLTGSMLITVKRSGQQIKILGLACLVGLSVGYGMDWTEIIPINKKISTASFVITSGAWSLVSFLLLYWLVDIKRYRRGVKFFIVVGMNPIFIYVFSRTIGRSFLNEFVTIFSKGIMNRAGISESITNLATFLSIIVIEWYMCYWLYKKRIFIKI